MHVPWVDANVEFKRLAPHYPRQSRVSLLRQHQAAQHPPASELRWNHILVNVTYHLGCLDISVEQFHQVSPDSTEKMRLAQHASAQQNALW